VDIAEGAIVHTQLYISNSLFQVNEISKQHGCNIVFRDLSKFVL